MSMSMWASTSAEEGNPAWLATQLGFISPSKPCFRLYIACSASSKPFLRLYTLAVHRRSLVFDYTRLQCIVEALFSTIHRLHCIVEASFATIHRLQCTVEALFATITLLHIAEA